MDAKLEERKAVRELISISLETMRQDESIQNECTSLGLDGWISNRTPVVHPLPRKIHVPRRHYRCLSARRTPSLPTDTSSKTLCDDTVTNSTIQEEDIPPVREPRVVQPFGTSSGNVTLPRNLMQQFPPRPPRRDLRLGAYVAYSLVKQTERKLSQPARSKDSLSTSRPPRPEITRRENPQNTPRFKEEKENKVGVVHSERVFTDNVKRYLQSSAQEQALQRQQHMQRLNTALTLAKFSL